MQSNEISMVPTAGGTAQQISVSGVSAQTSAITPQNTTNTLTSASPGVYALIYSTVDCFMRQGVNPTAVNNGTDQFVPGNMLLRVGPIAPGNKLAFITTGGSGIVYLNQEN